LIKKYSVIIAGCHATSITLEEEFYSELLTLAAEKNTTPNHLITEIDLQRTSSNLSSAIRIYILHALKEKLNNPLG